MAVFSGSEAEVTLKVVVTSADFTVYTQRAQSLRVPKRAPARPLDLQPLHPSRG
jgi:hypothetical protein